MSSRTVVRTPVDPSPRMLDNMRLYNITAASLALSYLDTDTPIPRSAPSLTEYAVACTGGL
jgi:hypothetical protein